MPIRKKTVKKTAKNGLSKIQRDALDIARARRVGAKAGRTVRKTEAEVTALVPRKRTRKRTSTPALVQIRAPVGMLPTVSDVTSQLVMPAAGALVMPDQPIIALAGLSTLVTSLRERKELLAKFEPEKIDIKPTGECYVAHIHLRERLSIVFGVGAWGMQPMGMPTPIEEEWVVAPWALYIRGHALSWTWGGARYQKKNKRQTWSDALETIKSDALKRLCKDIPMAGQCWDRRHNDRFKRNHCVLVYVETRDGTELWWRTKDLAPFPGEKGAHPESPNVDGYEAPAAAPPQAGRSRASGPRKISEKQAKRLLKIADQRGWKKHEVLAFLRDSCKVTPEEGKPADLWHFSVAILMNDYDGIVDVIEHGVE